MCTDELALLGATVKPEDIVEKVLECLDDSYRGVVDAINARDTTISFEQLHEKLINRELTIKAQSAQPVLGSFPASAHATSSRPYNNHQPRYNNYHPHSNRNIHLPKSVNNSPSTNNYNNNFTGSRPFLGKCQWCHTKGHSLQKCSIFNEKYPGITLHPLLPIRPTHRKPMLPLLPLSTTPLGFLTQELHIMLLKISQISFHQPYDGTEEIVIGDGSGLPITHTGSAYGGTTSQRTN
ncbi:hypothetical protein ACHQM5_018063 [Ranunculus cassubicifolius]